eukprot:4290149-Karenia_brevis.AAC.1
MHSVGVHSNAVCYNAAMTACVRSNQASAMSPESQRHYNQFHVSPDALKNLKESLTAGEVEKGVKELKRAAG